MSYCIIMTKSRHSFVDQMFDILGNKHLTLVELRRLIPVAHLRNIYEATIGISLDIVRQNHKVKLTLCVLFVLNI